MSINRIALKCFKIITLDYNTQSRLFMIFDVVLQFFLKNQKD